MGRYKGFMVVVEFVAEVVIGLIVLIIFAVLINLFT